MKKKPTTKPIPIKELAIVVWDDHYQSTEDDLRKPKEQCTITSTGMVVFEDGEQIKLALHYNGMNKIHEDVMTIKKKLIIEEIKRYPVRGKIKKYIPEVSKGDGR